MSRRDSPRVLDGLVYLGVRVLLCAVQSLSPHQCAGLAHFLGWLCSDLLRIRSRVIDENLRGAFPNLSDRERRQLRQRMWRHLFLLLCEIALAQRKIHHTNWRDYVHIHHAREIVSRMLSDRPLVVVTAHLGNFEMSGYIAGLLGLPTITIARDLDNVYLDRFLRRFRETTGQRIFSSKGTAELAQAVLESGGTLALLGDHHGGPKGCWVDFFGRPASCHKSVALFPLVNRLPLAVLVTTRVDRMLHFDMRCVSVWDPDRSCDAALQTVPELTQWYTYWIESAVKQAPDQYWWLHRRWKASASRTRKRN